MKQRSQDLYENDVLIDDPLVVLDILCKRWGDATVRVIKRWSEKYEGYTYIELRHCRDFGSDVVYYFKITSRVTDTLLEQRAIAGKPQWGYTEMRELSATDYGQKLLWEARSRLELQDRLRSDWWYERTSGQLQG